MFSRPLIPLLALVLGSSAFAQNSGAPSDPKPLIDKAVSAVGGADRLLRLFRIKEEFHFGETPEPKGGKETARESVLEPPLYWWLGKKDRADEPAKFDVWAWTLGAIFDPKSKVETIPNVIELEKPAWGLRVSGTITPPMELYFDKDTNLLVRIDWRSDIYRFSEWREHDGAKYPSRCIMYKKTTSKPWFYHRITEIERLTELPAGIIRTPLEKP